MFKPSLGQQEPNREPGGNEPVSFQQLRDSFLDSKCLGCHGAFGVKEVFDGLVDPGKPEISIMYIEVDSGSMPKFVARLDQSQIDLLEQYILDLQ